MEMHVRERNGNVEIIVDGRIRGRIMGLQVSPQEVKSPKRFFGFLGKHADRIVKCDEPTSD